MPRKSKTEVQKDKMEILSNLKRNSRLSVYNIGKILGCSRQKVWHMLKDLEGDGTIWGYTVVLNQSKCDKQHFILLIKRSGEVIDHSQCKMILSEDFNSLISDDLEIETFMCLYGEFDWLLVVNAVDVLSVKTFIAHIKNIFGKYIDDIIILESVNIIKKNWIKNPNIEMRKEIFEPLL